MKLLICLSLAFAVQVLLAPAAKGQALNCDQVQTDLRNVVQNAITQKDWPTTVNLIQTIAIRNREIAKVGPVTEADQSFVAVRNTVVNAMMAGDKQLEYNTRYQVARSKIIDDLNKAWFDYTSKSIKAVADKTTLTAPPDFDAIYNQFKTDCNDLNTATQTALKAMRDENNKMVLDAATALVSTRSLYSDIFDRGQLLLNNRLFDACQPQIEYLIAVNLIQYVQRLKNVLAVIGNTMTAKVNRANTSNRMKSVQTINDALTAFAPAVQQTDVNKFLTPLKADADKAIDLLRPMTNPADLRSGSLTMMAAYAKKADDATTTYTTAINTAFTDAVKKINAITI